jgi:type IX secretion system PorP/SprF family membrane protein
MPPGFLWLEWLRSGVHSGIPIAGINWKKYNGNKCSNFTLKCHGTYFLILLHLLLLLNLASTRAQDLNFSQFQELPLLRNPALAGEFIGDIRVQGVFRNQWQSVTVPYRTSGLSTEVNFPTNDYGHYLTVGGQLLYDVAGDSKLSRTHILPVVAYHAPLSHSEVYLSGSIMGGIVTSHFDPTALRWDDQFVNGAYNPTNPTRQLLLNQRKNYLDLGAGIAISGPASDVTDFYLGVGLFHANNPSVAFDDESVKLGRKWAFNGGLGIQTSDWNRVTFYADYFLQKAATGTTVKVGAQNVLMIGAFYSQDLAQYDAEDKTSITMGGIYRLNDAFAPVIRFDIKKFGVGLSYDVNVSDLTVASQARGGFELTMVYKNAFNSRVIKGYRMRCVAN